MSATITPWRAFRADPADWFEPEEVAKAKEYARRLRWVNGARKVLSLALVLGIARSHLIPELLGDQRNWVVRLFVAIVVVSVAQTLLAFPFSAWRSLSYDRRWGFSTQKLGGFLADQAKGLPLGIVISFVLFLPLWALIRTTELWWIFGWLVFAGFIVLFNVLFPVLIAPIFNKYTPLEDDSLRQRLLDVAERVEADISEYLVEDASKRDTRQNAYVAGLGKTRRVVIYDTMLDWPHDQIGAVVAHEIGHWKLKHIRRLLLAASLSTFVAFVVLKLGLEWDRALAFAGVESPGDPAVYPLFELLFTLAGPLPGLGVSWVSRAGEREADLFALETLREPATFLGMMRRLYTENLADLAPSWWRRISQSHPPVAERLAMTAAWAAQEGLDASAATGGSSASGDGSTRPRQRPRRARR